MMSNIRTPILQNTMKIFQISMQGKTNTLKNTSKTIDKFETRKCFKTQLVSKSIRAKSFVNASKFDSNVNEIFLCGELCEMLVNTKRWIWLT